MKETEQIIQQEELQRKRELIDMLEFLLSEQKSASQSLDDKAWGILRVSTTTFGIISGLQIAFAEEITFSGFRLSIFVVLFLFYSLLLYHVLLATRPMEWFAVPGTEDGKISKEKLVNKYIDTEENTYLNRLITDYAGTFDEAEKKFYPGAIQDTQEKNNLKTRQINRAAINLGFLTIGLIFLAIISIF